MGDSFIWIVRHGNTFEPDDVVTRVGGRTDIGLSLSGKAQALTLGEHFSERMFSSAQCGPLLRTCQTAEILLSFNRNAPKLKNIEFLREIDYGPDENRPENDVIARIGRDALDNWEKNLVAPDGWKVNHKFLTESWKNLINKLGSLAGHHLVVTSNGIARFALLAINVKLESVKLPTGGIGCIKIHKDQTKSVPCWGARPDCS